MSYPAGYIEISKERDIPLLKEALHAGFVTHAQLFELMNSPVWSHAARHSTGE